MTSLGESRWAVLLGPHEVAEIIAFLAIRIVLGDHRERGCDDGGRSRRLIQERVSAGAARLWGPCRSDSRLPVRGRGLSLRGAPSS